MKKLVIIVLFLGLFITSGTAAAQVQSYTSVYSSTNVYNSVALTYTFTGLDSATYYSWTLQIMRLDNPTAVDFTAQTLSCSGTTSCIINFNLFDIVPSDTFAPARVVDSFGQLLGKHFLAPGVEVAPWTQNQTNPADEKTVISYGARPFFDSISGYHHFSLLAFEGESIITVIGDYSILHYRTSIADYQNEFIEINVPSAATDSIAYFSVEEFVEYNRHTSDPSIHPSNIHGFVLINTSGERPAFISQIQDSAFANVYDNPHTLTMTAGIYNYARLDGAGAVKSIGESVWIVSSRKPDWSGTIRQTLKTGREQTVTLQATESAVYEAYPDLELLDCELGDPLTSCDVVDSTDYGFSTRRDIQFTVDVTPIESNSVVSQRNATSFQYGASVADFPLYFELGAYDIIAVVGLNERIMDIVLDSGVEKSTMFLVLFLILTMLTYGVLFAAHIRNSFAYGLVFLGYGVLFLTAGFFESWVLIIMGFLMVIVLIAMVRGSRSAAA